MSDIIILGGIVMFGGKPRKRADGRREIQLTIGKDENGKRIRKSFYGTKEKEVIAKKDVWLSGNHRDSMDDNHSSKLFSDWADYWLALKKTTVRPYTYQNTYYTRVKKYLKPYFWAAGFGSHHTNGYSDVFSKASAFVIGIAKNAESHSA